MWGVGCGAWGVGCGVWGVVCGVWGVEYGTCALTLGVGGRASEFGVRPRTPGAQGKRFSFQGRGSGKRGTWAVTLLRRRIGGVTRGAWGVVWNGEALVVCFRWPWGCEGRVKTRVGLVT